MEFNLDGKSQFCLLPGKSFNRFGSHLAFSQCVSKKTKTLVEEIQNALTKLSASRDSASSLSSSCNDVTDVDDTCNPESATTTSIASTEKVQNKSSSKSRKRKYLSSASTSTSTANPSTDDMQESCEKCLISSKSFYTMNCVKLAF